MLDCTPRKNAVRRKPDIQIAQPVKEVAYGATKSHQTRPQSWLVVAMTLDSERGSYKP